MISSASKKRSAVQNLLLLAGFGGVLFISTFVILGIFAPEYDSMRQPISALEFTTLSAAQRTNFAGFGLLLICFAFGLRRELAPGRGAILIPLFQAFSGIGVIGDSIFIHDPLHLTCDLLAFNSAILVLSLFAWRFHFEPDWTGWTTYSLATALAMMGLLTAFGFENHLGGPAGLFEKLATCTRTLWSAILAARLLSGRHLGNVRN